MIKSIRWVAIVAISLQFLLIPTSAIAAAKNKVIELPRVEPKLLPKSIRAKVAQAIKRIDAIQADSTANGRAMLYGNLGMLYQAGEQLKAAIILYTAAFDADSSDARWSYLLGYSLMQGGDIKDAYAAFRKSFAARDDYMPTLVNLGRLAVSKNSIAEGTKLFNVLYALPAFKVVAAEGLGEISLRSGHAKAAVKYFSEALKIQPQANRMYYQLALAYRKLGNKAEAERALKKRGEGMPAFPDPILAFISNMAPTAQKLLQRGVARAKAGAYSKAIIFFDRGLTLEPKNDMLLAAKGRVLEYLGKQKEAHTLYVHALKINPKNVAVLVNFAALQDAAGKLDSAAIFYQKALKLQPDNLDAQLLFAGMEFRRTRYAQAQVRFAQVLQRYPNNVTARFYEIVAILASGHCAQSLKPLQRARKRLRTDGTIAMLQAVAEYQCGPSAKKSAALALATQVYHSAPSMESSRVLAYLTGHEGKYSEAIDYQTQAIFEALKTRSIRRYPDLGINMKRLRSGQQPKWNWAQYAEEVAPPTPDRKTP